MSFCVKVTIDSALRVRHRDLPAGAGAQIRERLTIINEKKVEAVRRREYGASDMIDSFDLWSDDGEYLVMARGFAAELRAGLEAMGATLIWDDQTAAPPVPLRETMAMAVPTLDDFQERVVGALLKHRLGIAQAGTGAGKTVMALECYRRAGVTGMIMTHNIGLVEQWRVRAREHLGVETGLIGDGHWDIKPLTIAMIPTLYRRLDQLDADFWNQFGLTVVDEVHHAIADSWQAVIFNVRSRYLIGKTATPLDGDWRQRILTGVVGPIFHKTTDDELRKAGRRVVPKIEVVKTDFQWVPEGKDKALVDSRTIYGRVIKALEDDSARVRLIVDKIASQSSSCAQIVFSKRLGYLKTIHKHLALRYPADRIFYMRGEESLERRAEIARIANDGNCVILATVADEGTDIPRLDRLHLVWPQRKQLTITQQIGRGLRRHDNKTDTIVFDYADLNQGVLRSQFYSRKQVYTAAGYPVDLPNQMAIRRET